MNYAVIAAGEGSRLVQEGISLPKPMVRVAGTPLVERLLTLFVTAGAENIYVITNAEMVAVAQHIQAWASPEHLASLGAPLTVSVHILARTTRSSMHSLAALAPQIPPGRFCLTTVDTVCRPADFISLVRHFETMSPAEGDGLFAVTPYVDDEAPLYVATDAAGRITAFHDRREAGDRYVSGGIYCLDTRTAMPVLEACLAAGQSRMRNFQRALVAAGLRLIAFPMEKIIDVDHAADIAKAEAWLRQVETPAQL